MLRRFFSVAFILVLACNSWAGVCGCAERGQSSMKCCKKQTFHPTMGKKRCCGSSCVQNGRHGGDTVQAEKGPKLAVERGEMSSAPDAWFEDHLNTEPILPRRVVRFLGESDSGPPPAPRFLLNRSLRL